MCPNFVLFRKHSQTWVMPRQFNFTISLLTLSPWHFGEQFRISGWNFDLCIRLHLCLGFRVFASKKDIYTHVNLFHIILQTAQVLFRALVEKFVELASYLEKDKPIPCLRSIAIWVLRQTWSCQLSDEQESCLAKDQPTWVRWPASKLKCWLHLWTGPEDVAESSLDGEFN